MRKINKYITFIEMPLSINNKNFIKNVKYRISYETTDFYYVNGCMIDKLWEHKYYQVKEIIQRD